LGEVVERERARTLYKADREGSVRTVRATELPWLPVAPKTAILDLDILGVRCLVDLSVVEEVMRQ